MKSGLQLTSGFRKVPTVVGNGFYHTSAQKWIESVKEESNIGPYWRIHDKIYDLTAFMDKHPGGKYWIKTTKGMDITEAFESAHIKNVAESYLSKYFVKNISTARFSPFTFEKNGFYMTLKRKARIALRGVKHGPTSEMKLIQDILFVVFLSMLFVGTFTSSYTALILAGFLLTLSTNCAHNFFHQKDNWRMYLFDFSLLSSREWRVTHGLSHHLYPNTIHDFEIFAVEPYVALFPIPDKSFAQKYLACTPLNAFYFVSFLGDYIKRAIHIFVGEREFEYPFLFQPLLLTVMTLITNSWMSALVFWAILHFSFNFWFLWIGWAAGHHTKYAYVESDSANKDRDWGLHQVIAIAERKEPMENLFLASVTFGNHTLHHLFPTLDHSKLHLLLNPFLETCEEFNVNVTFYSMWDIFISMFFRFSNNRPNDASLKIKFNSPSI